MFLRFLLLVVAVFALPACSHFASKEQVVEPQIQIVEKVVIKEVPAVCPVCPAIPQQPSLETTKVCKPEPKKEVRVKKAVKPLTQTRLPIIGEVEWVAVNNKRNRFKARIDTGAATSSIHAEDIKVFERDGRTWASFNIQPYKKDKPLRVKAPVTRTTRIKQHDRASDKRYVVELTLIMGNIQMTAEVNLNDRTQFRYPLLIGRNFLEGNAIVDTSKRYMMLD